MRLANQLDLGMILVVFSTYDLTRAVAGLKTARLLESSGLFNVRSPAGRRQASAFGKLRIDT